jgi:uncharacterized protein (TIGR02271 family)
MQHEEHKVPLVEEQLSIGKRDVIDGEVRVRTRTTTATEAFDVDLFSEEVDVERVQIERIVDKAPEVRTEGDVMIVPVLEERLVVEKRLVLVEEVRIRRKSTFQTEHVEAELRKQIVSVERVETNATTKEN